MMKTLPLWLLLLVAALVVSGCKKKDDSWERTIAADTPEAYRAYIASHPGGEQTDMAKYHLERMVYRRALEEKTATAYTAYLEEFPQGQWAANARNQRASIINASIRNLPDDQVAGARVRFETSHGTFTVRLFPDKAPVTSRNFLGLAYSGFYDGLTFHYVDPKRLVQSGDPRGDSMGGPGYFIPLEQNDLKHNRGSLVMWHTPVDPNTAGSQFYLSLADLPERDGKFTVFGEVLEGLTTLDKISQVDTAGPDGKPTHRPSAPVLIDRTVTEGLKIE